MVNVWQAASEIRATDQEQFPGKKAPARAQIRGADIILKCIRSVAGEIRDANLKS